jgi:hypothetical protein
VTGSEGVQAAGRVAVLLSTYNGEQFLAEQLASFQQQSFAEWVLYWPELTP